MEEVFFQILLGIGKFFIHPLLYIGIVYAIYLGYKRVKRERKDFHIRIQDGWYEARTYLTKGLIPGVLLSIIIFLIGFHLPVSFVIVSGFILFLFGLLLKPGLLSPAFTFGLTFILLMVIESIQWKPPIFDAYFSANQGSFLPEIALLTGLFVILEGLLIHRNASKHTSPKIIRSKRGLKVGIHETKRLWLVPLLVLIPEGIFTSPFDFWPIVPVGNETFSIILVPYWIGFAQQIRITLPTEGVRAIGRQVIFLGLITTVIGLVSFWYSYVSFIAILFAVVGRIAIPILQRIQNNAHPYYFSKNEQGIVVLDIIPGSPAEKMNIKIGEVIKKVNGRTVTNEKNFYAALQKNRAFCKLEVVDEQREVRLVNRALYEGEHHELGVIFIDEEKQWETDVG
ncbi:PDZ domain-containing protein [Fervidibacillus halotolerans]|uniref:PDZ domain-containing protein n=1 Tax=Fervidibacillus halotolerans TaxID=2980027 RepID=A0A9E8RWQ4_9BACI|nr:PDZ domain-containing protein [Fervidibacillus halotolerans]WAA12000.1 PDZ domain-containing protein [Fervidibacillus halotolerans]